MHLSEYHAKRDFSGTQEPKGRRRRTGDAVAGGRFVIQKHAARRLHYDFRLEIDRVLKSWAVPKGIPTAQGEKRLAVEVEDHPVEYGSFEGVIPSGHYGAGTVMLWDTGRYQCLEHGPATAWREGKLELLLAGDKLQGHWTLVRMGRGQSNGEKAWLLIKTEETVPGLSARRDNCSVTSGRTMNQITAGKRGSRSAEAKRASRARTKPPGPGGVWARQQRKQP